MEHTELRELHHKLSTTEVQKISGMPQYGTWNTEHGTLKLELEMLLWFAFV